MQSIIKSDNFAEIKTFQVIGERCSGTNYAQAFFEENFNIPHTDSLGWKHGFPTFTAAPADLLAIVIFRNAHSWVRSMYGKPWHTTNEMREMTFHEFIRSQWDTYVDRAGYFKLPKGSPKIGQPLQLDRHPITGKAFKNIVEMRNAKIQSWLGFANRRMNVLYINYEKLVSDPMSIVSLVSDSFHLSARSDIRIPEGKFGWNWPKRVKSHPLPPLPLPSDDLDFINKHLNIVQEKRIGYCYA